MSQCTKSLLADYIAFSEANYLFPIYTLPANNFFRTIRQNPYYLANDLRNLAIAEERAQKEFSAAPTASVVNVFDWSEHRNDKSVVLHESASKAMNGPYFDSLNNKAGTQIVYTFNAELGLTPILTKKDAAIIVTFNLDAVPSVFVNNVLKYVETKGSSCETDCSPVTSYCASSPSGFNPCRTKDYKPGFIGVIGLKEKGAEKTDLTKRKVYDLADAVPLLPGSIECPGTNKVSYAILGNRLYFALLKDDDKEYDEVVALFSATVIEEKKTTLLGPLF